MSNEPDCFWETDNPLCCDGVLCPVEENHAESHHEDDDMEMEGMVPGWAAQVAYLSVATVMTTRAGLLMWRYESGGLWDSKIDAYDAAVEGWNMLKLGQMINRYTDLSVFGLLWIFQLLALFGVA